MNFLASFLMLLLTFSAAFSQTQEPTQLPTEVSVPTVPPVTSFPTLTPSETPSTEIPTFAPTISTPLPSPSDFCFSEPNITNYLTYGNTEYALIDNSDLNSYQIGGQWKRFYTLPQGWSLASNSGQTRTAVACVPLSTNYAVLEDGSTVNSLLFPGRNYQLRSRLCTDGNVGFSVNGGQEKVMIQRTLNYANELDFNIFSYNTSLWIPYQSGYALNTTNQKPTVRLVSSSNSQTYGFLQIITTDWNGNRLSESAWNTLYMFACASSTNVSGENPGFRSLYADIFYVDGSTDYSLYATFDPNSKLSCVDGAFPISPGKRIDYINFYTLFRNHSGSITVSNWYVTVLNKTCLESYWSGNSYKTINGSVALQKKEVNIRTEVFSGIPDLRVFKRDLQAISPKDSSASSALGASSLIIILAIVCTLMKQIILN